MFFLQLFGQRSPFVKSGRQLHGSTQGIGNRSSSRLAVLPIASHDSKLLRNHFGKGGLAMQGFTLGQFQHFRIQINGQSGVHKRNLSQITSLGQEASSRTNGRPSALFLLSLLLRRDNRLATTTRYGGGLDSRRTGHARDAVVDHPGIGAIDDLRVVEIATVLQGCVCTGRHEHNGQGRAGEKEGRSHAGKINRFAGKLSMRDSLNLKGLPFSIRAP